MTIRIRWLYILTALICIIPCALLSAHWLHHGFHDNLRSATKYFAKYISEVWSGGHKSIKEGFMGVASFIALLTFVLGPEMLAGALFVVILYYVFALTASAFLGAFFLVFGLLFVSEKVFILTALLGTLIGLGLNRITVYTIAYHILIAVGSLWVEKVALTINVGGRHVQKERQRRG